MEIITVQADEKLQFSSSGLTHETEQNSKFYEFNSLQKISILTNDQGPFLDDQAIAFFFNQATLILPSEHIAFMEISDEVTSTFDVNLENVMASMSCTENAEFIIWTV